MLDRRVMVVEVLLEPEVPLVAVELELVQEVLVVVVVQEAVEREGPPVEVQVVPEVAQVVPEVAQVLLEVAGGSCGSCGCIGGQTDQQDIVRLQRSAFFTKK